MAEKTEYKFDNGKVLDWGSMPKTNLKKYSNAELERAASWLWENSASFKGDLIVSYSTLVLSEINDRAAKRTTRWNYFFSFLALIISLYSVWLTVQNTEDTKNSINVANNSLELTKKSIEKMDEQIQLERQWMEAEIKIFNRLAEPKGKK